MRHEQLASISSGRIVTVAGLVLVRQRPGSANGVIFMTLEDETNIANIIVWPKTFEIFRPVVLGARLVSVTGKLQNESGVIHVVADRIDDLTPLLRRLSEHGASVETLAHCDEVKRPDPGYRSPKHRPNRRARSIKPIVPADHSLPSCLRAAIFIEAYALASPARHSGIARQREARNP